MLGKKRNSNTKWRPKMATHLGDHKMATDLCDHKMATDLWDHKRPADLSDHKRATDLRDDKIATDLCHHKMATDSYMNLTQEALHNVKYHSSLLGIPSQRSVH